jgi:uncharacterized protein (TIGR02147 family)
VALDGFREDPEWIGRMLLPAVRPAQVERAIDTLIELGLLRRNDAGALEQCAPVVSTGSEVTRSLHLANYHRSMSDKAMQSIETVPAGERDISALTLTTTASGLARIKARLAEFRRELIELSEAEPAADQVLQLNFHCFPLSRAALSGEES